MPRVALASLMQESNTNNPVASTLETFERSTLWRGAEVMERGRGSSVEIGGFIDVLEGAGIDIIPVLAAHAGPGGPLERSVREHLIDAIVDGCRHAGDLDGIALSLHGALSSAGEPDVEGALLEGLRAAFPTAVIAASLDLHAHVTPRMVANADLLVGYQTYPHVDMRQTGERTARLLLDVLAGRTRPRMALAKLPLLLSPVDARTDSGPLHDIAAEARALERDGLLAVSIFPVQPWLDVPGLGFAVLAVEDAAHAGPLRADHAAHELANTVWTRRAEFEPDLTPLTVALAEARRYDTDNPRRRRPFVIGDAGDAPSCGATGDEPTVLAALVAGGFEGGFAGHDGPVMLTLCDPHAARAAHAAGVGALVDVAVGHGISGRGDERVRLSWVVEALRDSPFSFVGPGLRGMPLDAGPMALLARGALRLVVTSRPTMEWDTAPFEAVGLDPSSASLVFVKSPSHFRAVYHPLAERLWIADTPGASRCSMRALRFEHVGHDLFPIREDVTI